MVDGQYTRPSTMVINYCKIVIFAAPSFFPLTLSSRRYMPDFRCLTGTIN